MAEQRPDEPPVTSHMERWLRLIYREQQRTADILQSMKDTADAMADEPIGDGTVELREPESLGGPWYKLPDGTKIKGYDKALELANKGLKEPGARKQNRG